MRKLLPHKRCSAAMMLIRIACVGLVVAANMVCTVSFSFAGPLAGGTAQSDQEIAPQTKSVEDEEQSLSQSDLNSVVRQTPDVLVYSYLEAMRQQVLPDIDSSATGVESMIDLDRLQGWSLEEIAATFAPNDPSINDGKLNNITRGVDDGLVVSVEDLYAFNAGYYFSITGGDESGEVLSAPDIPNLIGISALGTLDFNLINQNEATTFGLSINSSNVLFDRQFFEAVSRSPTENRSFGNVSFRSSLLNNSAQSGGGGGSNSRTAVEGIPLLVFIQRIISGIRENWGAFLLLGVGVTSVVYVTTRFSS